MSVTGEIKNLYSDKDKTRVLLPRTKTKAVSDENGTSLDVLLEGKAPAGFGLGNDNSRFISESEDLDSYRSNGFYSWAVAPKNSPCFDNGIMIIASYDWARKVQFVWSTGDPRGCMVQRVQYANIWGEWEWINPPMELGVEYRTTERWNGAVVYAKLVGYTPSGTIGNTSEVTDILVPHGITGFNRLVRVEGTVFYTIPLPLVSSDGLVSTAVTTVNNKNIELRVYKRTWNNAHPFTFALYYTK